MIGHAVAEQTRPNRRHWLAKRRRGITATDVPAILGLSPWRTPLDVWLDKTGRSEPVEPSYAMRRGTVLEALLLTEYAQRTNACLLPVPVLAAHPVHRWALASLDGAAAHPDGQVRIVECKTAGWRSREDWWDDDTQIPDHYLAQIAWQQFVCGVDFASVIADVAGEVRIIGPIPRSTDWEDYAVPIIDRWFRTHVRGGEPPDPDPVRDYQSMNLLWKPDPRETVFADHAIAQAVADYRQWQEVAAADKRSADELRGTIRAFMGTAAVLEDVNGEKLAAIDRRGALRITGGAS